ncbi:unnamed protein product [Clonostachys rhizophaga]|uniref:Fe2OG dioxygenase domain-containing protein n=1 Tax=Clonostachys rhizophaga TaxID=160324 RepID=A0A9N9VR17_9HYPO|nr:unnamed protein product [Clonostachys rhizophaga]
MADVLDNHNLPDATKDPSKFVYFHSGSKASYRPITSTQKAFTSIPTIDLTNIDSPSLELRQAIAKEMYTACHDVGFFYVVNHGIPQSVIDDAFKLLKRFFALERDIKMDAHVQKNPAIRGYEPMGETKLDPRTRGDVKEAFTMGDCPLEPEQDYVGKTGQPPPSHLKRPQNIWPSEAPWWREGLYQYYNHVLPLAMKLVKLFALGLGLPEDELDQYFKFPITGMRPLYYPPTPVDNDNKDVTNVGLGAHSDFDWLTLVLQDSVPALEVLNQSGQWVSAPPTPGTLVCNVGQFLERQTNGLFPATVHRVRNLTGLERYSLPFFLTMDVDAEVDVLECCQREGEEKQYEKVKVSDLYIRRILPARAKHPTAIKYKDVPEDQWTYDMLLQ